jgi:hypothetical protein
MTELADAAVRIVTALRADQLIGDAAGDLPQRAWKSLAYADAVFTGVAAIAIRIFTALGADQLAADTTGDSIRAKNGVWFAGAVATVKAVVTIRVMAALGADQLVVDAACDQPQFAENDVWFAETIDAGGALAALARFAAFIAVHAFDGRVCRWTGDTAKLVIGTNSYTGIHTHVAEFARVVTQQRLAHAGFAAASAGIAIVVPAAFLANTGAAKQTGGTIGRACTAIGWVFLQVDAFAVTTGQPFGTVGEACATEPRGDADAVATLFSLGIATSGAADKGCLLTGALGVALRARGAVR